mmetsp:Transcript_40967/g.112615  ORF Transcript_40967/g.112615 Transcript_40967/m.112615 type:complete len:761 (-) Transcript_40967:75-2357(-)
MPQAAWDVLQAVVGEMCEKDNAVGFLQAAAPGGGGGRFGLGDLELEPLDDDCTSGSDAMLDEPATEILDVPSSTQQTAGSVHADPPNVGTFGLGLLELEALGGDEDSASEEAEACRNSGGKASNAEPHEGWAALRALVTDGDGDGKVDELQGSGEEDASVADSFEIHEDADEEIDEEGDSESDIADGNLSDFDEYGSCLGSDFDPCDDDVDFDDGNGELSQGLIMPTFSGGSLHAAEPRRWHDTPSRTRGASRSNACIVFPSLIWRGKGIMVLNKPADWVCSASDVHKKLGRRADPAEQVANVNIKSLDDLKACKFRNGDRKYIHWWIQLVHDLDEESYPNLFDVDQNYGLCHRLDRETSGALLVGLTQLARQQMRGCFHKHHVRKLYVCLAHGTVEPQKQTIDRNLQSMGQRVRLSPKGQRARTHVKVLGYYSRRSDDGRLEDYSLCTCEIAEGRMHQIRIHMSQAIGAAIVSELFYQDRIQKAEDRRWCPRVFLHAYAVGFPDVSGADRGKGKDKQQEWHCCICPLTEDLRNALACLEPKDGQSSILLKLMRETGVLSPNHQIVHCMGTAARKKEIDTPFFPWSSIVNPIDDDDVLQPSTWQSARPKLRPDKARPKLRPRPSSPQMLGSDARRVNGGTRRGVHAPPLQRTLPLGLRERPTRNVLRPAVPLRSRSCGASPSPLRTRSPELRWRVRPISRPRSSDSPPRPLPIRRSRSRPRRTPPELPPPPPKRKRRRRRLRDEDFDEFDEIYAPQAWEG